MASSRTSVDSSSGDRCRLILDRDYAVDDALAVLDLLGHADAEIVGIGTVHGSTHAATASRNAPAVLEVADRIDVPVAVRPRLSGRDGQLTGERRR